MSGDAAMNVSPLAVTLGPPLLGAPRMRDNGHGASRSSVPSGTSQRFSPERKSTATSVPHGGATHGTPSGDISGSTRTQYGVPHIEAPTLEAVAFGFGYCQAEDHLPNIMRGFITARGKLVVEDALVAELETGRIAAMLDVTHPEPPQAGHPFYRLPNCWLTPHRAGSSAGEVRRMGRYAIEDCLRIIAGEEPAWQVHEHMLATMA